MNLAIVFPMFWGREKAHLVREGDFFYDHPTALDDEGTIPVLFESFRALRDHSFEVIAVAGAGHPSLNGRTERAAQALLSRYAREAGVTLHFFSYSHLEALHAALREMGKEELCETIGLVGYSPLRNACFVAAQLLGKEVAVSIDDDCIFSDEAYIGHVKEKMLSDFEGRKITALCGPYITAKDAIYLDPPRAPHTAYWNVIEVMNQAFRQYIVEAPGMSDVPFAIMGNIAVHREFFARCPLDPPLPRGEDSDWVMNAHILGERFVMDPGLRIKHCPPPRPYPVWRPLREDIYRFRYQQEKIANSREGDGYHRLERERYLPFPGEFYREGFREKITHACEILAMDYLSRGEPEHARETLNNIYHERYLAAPVSDPFASFLRFQKKWEEMMGLIDEQRDVLRQRVFG